MATIIITLSDDDVNQRVEITAHGDILPLEQIDEKSTSAQITYGHILCAINELKDDVVQNI